MAVGSLGGLDPGESMQRALIRSWQNKPPRVTCTPLNRRDQPLQQASLSCESRCDSTDSILLAAIYLRKLFHETRKALLWYKPAPEEPPYLYESPTRNFHASQLTFSHSLLQQFELLLVEYLRVLRHFDARRDLLAVSGPLLGVQRQL